MKAASQSVERTSAATAAVTLHRPLLWLAYITAAAAFLYFALRGVGYYLSPLVERARHPQYWQLKPGGSLGLRFGYAGATMMTVLLLYSVRKRLPWMRRVGTLRKWLDWHIFLGIYGPLFIVLHSSLKVGGLVSISFWSMVAVALSGVLGRFLYQQIPRSLAGEEISRVALVAEDQKRISALASRWSLETEQVSEVLRLSESGAVGRSGALGLLLQLPLSGAVLRLRIARHARRWRGLDRAMRRRAAAAALELARFHRRLLLLDRVRQLFGYWHVFHKPFAVILYVLMVVHIAVAWMTGYGRLGA